MFNELGEKKIQLSYQDLIHNTDVVLHDLSSFLELQVPLKKTYNTDSSPVLYGDRSNNIEKGTILDTGPAFIDLPSSLLLKAQKAYDRFCHSTKNSLR